MYNKHMHSTKFIDLTGLKFGFLTVISQATRKSKYIALWSCMCTCGTAKVVEGAQLRKGKTKSCGCIRSMLSSNRFAKHGGTGTSEYGIWKSMKSRCSNVNDKAYKYYGGRGISVCERWANSFEMFLLDMGQRPTSDLSIDRMDNNGNYEPSNCHWATRKEQTMNRRCSLASS